MISEETGIISLEDLPGCNWIYLDKEGVIRDFIDELIIHFSCMGYGCIKKLSNLTGIKQGTLQKFHGRKRKKLKITYLKQLLSFLPKNEQQTVINTIQKHIVKIGFRRPSIINLKLPINFASVDGAEFLGDLLTDGSLNSNLQVTYSNTNLYRILRNLQSAHSLLTGKDIFLTNKERNILNSKDNQKILYLIKNLIKKSKVKCCFVLSKKKDMYGNEYAVYHLIYTPTLGKVLNRNLKIPKGRRVYTNPTVPKLILTSKKYSAAFIGRVFSNEGHVENYGATISHSIDLTNILIKNSFSNKGRLKQFLEARREKFAPKLLWGYKQIFYLLGCNKPSSPYVTRIYFTKNKEMRIKFSIYIGGEDVNNLYQIVEFDEDFKEKLEKYLNSVKYFRVQKVLLAKQILDIGRDIQNKHGYFTVPRIISEADLESSTVQKHIKKALDKGLIAMRGKEGHAPIYEVIKTA